MFLMKILSNTFLFLLLHIWLRVGLTSLALRWNTTYPNMSGYHSNVMDPVKNCPDFDCESSKMTQIEINTFVNLENTKRNDYARSKGIVNLYRVFWDEQLAEFAKLKVQLCLPTTFEGHDEKYQIFDEQAVDQAYPKSSPHRVHSAVVQVVSGRRVAHNITTDAQTTDFRLKSTDYYVNLFYSDDRSYQLRGATTLMGCAYVLQRINSTYIDRLLCAYGMFYTDKSFTYVATVGSVPCSNCTNFEAKLHQDSRPSAIDGAEKWGCDASYASLCADLANSQGSKIGEVMFDCKDPKAGIRFDFGRPSDKIVFEIKDEPEKVPVPCWYITAPLGLITIIILGLCVFHTITATITYISYRKTRQQRVTK